MEKLNCKSLMIGDWVKTKSIQKQVKVKEIKQSCIYTEDNGYEYNEVEPIPLAPEVLEKIGFVKYIAGQYVLPKMVGEILVSIMPMKGLPNANAEWIVSIKNGYTDVKIPITYIHELQHALKICGIKKEIEL